jgi:hypothetical protein
MATFDVDANLAKDVAAQRISDGPIDSGVYAAEIKNSFIRQTENGASMWEVELYLPKEDRSLFYSTAVKSRTGSTTFTKNDKSFLLPGLQELIRYERVTTGNEAINGENGKAMFKDNPIDAFILKETIGLKVLVGVRQYENFYNGTTSIRNMISHWMSPDGAGDNGEDISDKVASFLARNPIKRLPNKAPAPVAGATPEVPKGW